MRLKNRYIAIAYDGWVHKKKLRQVSRELFEATINKKAMNKALLSCVIKLTAKAYDTCKTDLDFILWFTKSKNEEKIRAIINHDVTYKTEKRKEEVIERYIDENRKSGKWFYLASSHDDCAEDHIPWQGKLYADETAPEDVLKIASNMGLYTLQYVMGSPAWFMTRPNCRHYIVGVSTQEAQELSVSELTTKYHTHSKVGNRYNRNVEILNNYIDRGRMLRDMYRVKPNEELKNMIARTDVLIHKWRKGV